jgi:hypothetical protein
MQPRSKVLALCIAGFLIAEAFYLRADPVIYRFQENKVIFIQPKPDKPTETYIILQSGTITSIYNANPKPIK